MSDEELKNCPFCGHEAEVKKEVVSFSHLIGYAAECSNCGNKTEGYLNRAEAITAWNRRAPVEPAIEADTIAERLRRIEEKLDDEWNRRADTGISVFLDGECIVDGFGNRWPGLCPDCGAPMQIVSPGRAECSASCWLDDDDDDDDWHEDDDKRGTGGYVNCRCWVDEPDDDLTARIEAVEDRIENLSRGIAERFDAFRGYARNEIAAGDEALSDRIAKLEKQVILLRAMAAGE